MHSSCAAGCKDNRLCPRNHQLPGLHIHQNRACGSAVFIEYQFDSGGKVHDRYAKIDDLVTQGAHYLSSGIVLGSVHSLSGCTAAMGGYHTAVLIFIEHNAEVFQP